MPATGDRITKRKDGLFQGMYMAQTPDGPKRKYIYGRKYGEVKRKLAEAMGDAAKGIYFDDENQTVTQYMERWIEDSARGDLGHRAYHNYKLQIRRHISPAFGRFKLSKLTAAHIQSLYAAKLRDGLKPSSVRYIHAVLHRALEQAVRFNLIPFNPAARVDPPKIRQEEITPLDAEQARRFLHVARGDRFEALYVLSLTTGLRMGEALGLRWSDVDLDSGTLRVNRQVQRMRGGGGLVFSEPKNASRRTLELPQRAVEALRSHRKKQAEGEAKGDRLRGLRTRVRYGQGHSPRLPEHSQQVLQAPAQACWLARHKVARSQTHLRDPAPSSRHPPDLRSEVFGTRVRSANT